MAPLHHRCQTSTPIPQAHTTWLTMGSPCGSSARTAYFADGKQSAGLREINACRDLERDVDYDPEVRALLDGAGSAEAVRERMTEYVDGAEEYTIKNKTGRPEVMNVSFREYDPAVTYVRFQP